MKGERGNERSSASRVTEVSTSRDGVTVQANAYSPLW